jgi:palmitoyltransferase
MEEVRHCKKCPPAPNFSRPPKPERTHHCSVCRTCILKFDHQLRSFPSFPPLVDDFMFSSHLTHPNSFHSLSCPWINGCVGLHNERYFLLFLFYFSIACFFAAYWGFKPMWRAMGFGENWKVRFSLTSFSPLSKEAKLTLSFRQLAAGVGSSNTKGVYAPH